MSERSSRTRVWVKAVLALEFIWALTGGAIYFLHARQPTAPQVIAWLQQQNAAPLSPNERSRVVDEMAGKLSRLNYAQLEQVRFSHLLGRVYGPLSIAEKKRCAELIVPLTIGRILDTSRTLPKERRIDFVAGSIFNHELEWLLAKPQLPSVAYERIRQDAFRGYLDGLHSGDRMQLEQLWQEYRGDRR